MPRSDRLLRLLQAMRVMSPPITAERLAEQSGVSLRSLYRDIDSLRLAGARIEGERGYGYRLVEDYALPPQTFERIEIEAIVLGLAQVRAMGDPELSQAADAVLAKVAATLPDDREQQLLHSISHVYRPDARLSVSPLVRPVRQACWQEAALDVVYRDKGAAETRRTIYPLAMVYTDGALTVLAWCCLRQDFRMFRMDGLMEAQANGASFRPRRAAMLRDYLALLRVRKAARERG